MSIHISKSCDPTWPRWAVSGKTSNTQWFKTLAEAEAFAGFKYVEPPKMIRITSAAYSALVAVAEAAEQTIREQGEGNPMLCKALANLAVVRQNGGAK